MTPPERLVAMTNQIAQAFAYKGEAGAIAAVSEHLRKFWAPRMREAVRDYLAQGGDGLGPIARRAVEDLDVNKAA